jgi:hypothetical protein
LDTILLTQNLKVLGLWVLSLIEATPLGATPLGAELVIETRNVSQDSSKDSNKNSLNSSSSNLIPIPDI